MDGVVKGSIPKCRSVYIMDDVHIQSLVTLSYNVGWLSSKLPFEAHKILYQIKQISCDGHMFEILESPPNATMSNLLGRFHACDGPFMYTSHTLEPC